MPDAVGDRRIVEFHRQISPFSGHFHQRPVVAPHEGTAAVGSQIVVQLALAAPHTFDTPESFEVRPPDVGNQAEIGLGDRTEQAISPQALAPISTTPNSVSRVIASSVRGTPIWLLRLPCVA